MRMYIVSVVWRKHEENTYKYIIIIHIYSNTIYMLDCVAMALGNLFQKFLQWKVLFFLLHCVFCVWYLFLSLMLIYIYTWCIKNVFWNIFSLLFYCYNAPLYVCMFLYWHLFLFYCRFLLLSSFFAVVVSCIHHTFDFYPTWNMIISCVALSLFVIILSVSFTTPTQYKCFIFFFIKKNDEGNTYNFMTCLNVR